VSPRLRGRFFLPHLRSNPLISQNGTALSVLSLVIKLNSATTRGQNPLIV
jgi:hypothetical protein